MKHFFLLLFLLPISLFSQSDGHKLCGTPESELTHLLQEYAYSSLENGDSIGTLLVRIYSFSNGPLTFSPSQEQRLVNSINGTNELFEGSGIQFELCQEPIYIDSIYYSSNDFYKWEQENVDPRFINIYSGTVPFYCGIAYNIGGGGLSSTAVTCNNPQVVAHEFGHLLGLHHTFNSLTGQQYSQELVNGVNCDTTGDGVCDTPADPYPLGGDLDSCAYTGTVTDANGQLYMPHIQNNMSYYQYNGYGCGEEEFTEGQFARMRATIRQNLFYLIRKPGSMSLPSIGGAPSYVCVGDSTVYQLSSNQIGGIFSGDGVTGNTLFLGNLPVGEYEIQYQPPQVQAVAPYQKIDYVQIRYGYGGEPDTNVWWQGFRAKETANMNAFHLRASANVDEAFQWAIYSGLGTQGTAIYQQIDTFEASSEMRWRRFNLDTLLQQYEDSVYTLAFWTDSSTTLDVDMAYGGGITNQLMGSISTTNGPFFTYYHPCFATEISSTQLLCNEPIRKRIRIIEPREFPYTIEDNFCIADGEIPLDSLIPIRATWVYPQRTYLINQTTDSILRPIDLGPGEHDLLVINEDYNGCTLEKTFPIRVADVPHIQIPDSFCQGEPAFPLTGLWPEGNYWLDGLSIDSIQPTQLAEGSYQLDMYLPNVYDTLAFEDQQLLFPDSGTVGFHLGQNSVFWQSFIPDSAFFFHSAAFRMGVLDSIEIVGELWMGEIESGTILLRDTFFLPPDPNNNHPKVIMSKELNIPMTPDSVYTFAMRPILFTGNRGIIVGGKKNPYTKGIGSPIDTLYPEMDWLFKIFHQKERNCGSEIQQPIHIRPQAIPPASFLAGPDTVVLGSTVAYAWNTDWADSLDSLILSLNGASCLNCPPSGDSIYIQWDSLGSNEIKVLGINSCGTEESSKSVWVYSPNNTAINELGLEGLQLYPNPFTHSLTIRLGQHYGRLMHLDFYDLRGRLISQKEEVLGKSQVYTVSTEDLPKGSYLLQIRVGERLARRLVVRE